MIMIWKGKWWSFSQLSHWSLSHWSVSVTGVIASETTGSPEIRESNLF